MDTGTLYLIISAVLAALAAVMMICGLIAKSNAEKEAGPPVKSATGIGGWSSELCGCCDDGNICWAGLCCSCLLIPQLVSRATRSSKRFHLFVSLLICLVVLFCIGAALNDLNYLHLFCVINTERPGCSWWSPIDEEYLMSGKFHAVGVCATLVWLFSCILHCCLNCSARNRIKVRRLHPLPRPSNSLSDLSV